MKKEERKKLEQSLKSAISALLSNHSAIASKAIEKHIAESAKIIAKKFSKALPKEPSTKAPVKAKASIPKKAISKVAKK
jgi:hypothetical protein